MRRSKDIQEHIDSPSDWRRDHQLREKAMSQFDVAAKSLSDCCRCGCRCRGHPSYIDSPNDWGRDRQNPLRREKSYVAFLFCNKFVEWNLPLNVLMQACAQRH